MLYIKKSYKLLKEIGVYGQKWLLILYIFMWGGYCTSKTISDIMRTMIYVHGDTDEYEDIKQFLDIIFYIFEIGLWCLILYTLFRLTNFVEDMHMYQIAKSLTHHYSNECEE